MSVVPLRRDRSATIGGSDVAAAAGIDPHRSRVMLWLEKTGRYVRPETEAMRFGKLLEPAIFEALLEDGHPVTPYTAEPLQDPEREWLRGTPDGFAGDAVLEVKTTNTWTHRANGLAVPLHYVAQGQVYAHLTGLSRIVFAVLVNGQHLEVHEVPRNDEAIGLLLEAAERMHWHVVTDTQPPIGPSDSDRDALAVMYPQATEERVRLDKEAMRDVHELRARREQRKAIEAQEQELENRLKARMGDAALAISPTDQEVLRWTNVESRRIDTKRLRAEAPHVAEQYTTTTTSRRFLPL